MLLNQTITIGFKVPEEFPQMIDFTQKHDMSEWQESSCTDYVFYSKASTSITEPKEAE